MTNAIEELKRDIAGGTFDEALAELEKIVQDRLMAVRKSHTAAKFGIGDKVVFNTYCGTKYLHGHKATVTGIRGKKILVTLDVPVGRFARFENGELSSSQISVPPSIVDLVK